jgi:hypothetical protein
MRTASKPRQKVTSEMRHPPPVTIRPILRCRPLLVSGIPILLEILDFAAEIPTARFQEKPPLFTLPLESDRSSASG